MGNRAPGREEGEGPAGGEGGRIPSMIDCMVSLRVSLAVETREGGRFVFLLLWFLKRSFMMFDVCSCVFNCAGGMLKTKQKHRYGGTTRRTQSKQGSRGKPVLQHVGGKMYTQQQRSSTIRVQVCSI